MIGDSPQNTIFNALQLKSLRNMNVDISNISISNNSGLETISILASNDINISRCAIFSNKRIDSYYGATIFISNSTDIQFINCTIVNNTAEDRYGNPSINAALRWNYSDLTILNSIFWFNGPEPIRTFALPYLYGGGGNNLSITFSNFEYGDSCFTLPVVGNVHWLDGNLAHDPMFRDTLNGDYRLRIGSPCIDAGIQDTVIIYNDGLNTIYVPAMEYLGSAPDMGAFEFDITSVDKQNTSVPLTFALYQNYPNPFNPVTYIPYSIPKACKVMIQIYNSLGQRVQTLVNEMKPAGKYTIQFNASHLASGVYFYRIEAGSFKQVKKMLLIK
jgi:hypothetical protein